MSPGLAEDGARPRGWRGLAGVCVLTGLAVLAVLRAGEAASPAALGERVGARLEAAREELIAVRRDLHRNPEVSGEEDRTAGVVAARLGRHGFEVRTGVGGHGVVGILRGGKSGPVVAFRADMDAVPSDAPDPVEFRSEVPGVRHICGHDIHTTVGLALAEGLSAVREELPGTVMLIFQPAEENATGARAMLADGVLADPRPGAIFAYHTTPYPAGVVGSHSGTALAARDLVRVTVRGEGDLESAAWTIGEVIEGLSTLSGDQLGGMVEEDFLVSRIHRFERGAGENEWELAAMLTTTSDALRQDARRAIQRAVEKLPEGTTGTLDYQARMIAGVTNDPGLERRMRPVLAEALGEQGLAISTGVPPLFSEDFGSFQDEVPGVMYWLGVSNPEKGWVGMPHSPGYVADEEAIFVGARAMAAVLLDYLSNPG